MVCQEIRDRREEDIFIKIKKLLKKMKIIKKIKMRR